MYVIEFKLECYEVRTLNITSLVTTKKTSKEYTQKEMRKEFECFSTKYQLNTKEDRNAGDKDKKLPGL